MNAALGNFDHSGRHLRDQPQRSIERHLERMQIAIVHAHNLRARRERRIQFMIVMNLAPAPPSHTAPPAPETPASAPHPESPRSADRVSPMRGGLDDMEFVDSEVLAQNRNGNRRARRFEIPQPALKKLLVRQNAQSRRATRRIQFRDRSRMKVVREDALAGRRLFDLGNDRRRCRRERARGSPGQENDRPRGAPVQRVGRMRARAWSACGRQF